MRLLSSVRVARGWRRFGLADECGRIDCDVVAQRRSWRQHKQGRCQLAGG